MSTGLGKGKKKLQCKILVSLSLQNHSCHVPLWASADSPTKGSHQRLLAVVLFCAIGYRFIFFFFFTDVQLWILADCVTGLLSHGVDELLVSLANARRGQSNGMPNNIKPLSLEKFYQAGWDITLTHTHPHTHTHTNAYPNRYIRNRRQNSFKQCFSCQ